MKSRRVLTATAAGLVCAQALAASPADPWARVPALPTACYPSQDPWPARLEAAHEAVQQDKYRQDETNDAIRQNATDAFGADPIAMAQRMQQKMMEDPANAQKIMEEMLQQSQQTQAEAPARLAKEQQIENESKAVLKQYEAALDKAKGPGNARLAALTKRTTPTKGAFNLWLRYGDPGDPAWVKPERDAIMKQWDEAYVATCSQWWSATGPFHAYMKRYRDFLVQERIPYEKKGDAAQLEQYRQINVSTKGWRTTTDYRAALDYMSMARKLFGEREPDPLCRRENHCQ